MSCRVLVVGLPAASGCAPNQTWRAAAAFVQRRLQQRFGSQVDFEYAQLFSSDMANWPDIEAQIAAGDVVPPIVVINGVCRFTGGKLNVSAIERAVDEALSIGVRVPSPMEESTL